MERWMIGASLSLAFLLSNSYGIFKSTSARSLSAIRFPMPEANNKDSKHLHLIVLVHGIFGNPDELSFLKTSLEKHAKGKDSEFLVHPAQANTDTTTDGIASGGGRLAQEVNHWIEELNTDKQLSLSFVGNSLGGLYARYALSGIHFEERKIVPAVFCTTATPHLGVAAPHTYLTIGNIGEYAAASFMGQTGMDLFRKTSVIQDMTVFPSFTDKLASFRRRLCLANAYNTDFQVPCSTAAFLSRTDSQHLHIEKPEPLQDGSFVALRVETKPAKDTTPVTPDASTTLSSDELATRLDGLGWTKVFCDVRKSLIAASLPFEKSTYELPESESYTSNQLWDAYATFFSDNRWHIPTGHQMMVANSKTELQAKLNAGGQPIMDLLAKEIIDEITETENECFEKSEQDQLDCKVQ